MFHQRREELELMSFTLLLEHGLVEEEKVEDMMERISLIISEVQCYA